MRLHRSYQHTKFCSLDLRKIILKIHFFSRWRRPARMIRLSFALTPRPEEIRRRGAECNSFKGSIVNKLSRGEDQAWHSIAALFCAHEIPTAICPLTLYRSSPASHRSPRSLENYAVSLLIYRQLKQAMRIKKPVEVRTVLENDEQFCSSVVVHRSFS